MICLPGSTNISGLGVDTSDTVTSRPRAELLPGMNAAAKLLNPQVRKAKQWSDLSLREKIYTWWLEGERWQKVAVVGVAGLTTILVGRKLLKK